MIQIGFLTVDLIILIVLFGFTFFVAYRQSKKSVSRFIIPFYVATLSYSTVLVAYADRVETASAKILLFLAIYAALIFLMRNSITASLGGYGTRHFLDSVCLALAAIFSLFIAYFKILPIDEILKINFPFSAWILENIPYYLLMLIPLILIYLSNAHRD